MVQLVKDPELSLLWLRNFHMPWVQRKKKKKKKRYAMFQYHNT